MPTYEIIPETTINGYDLSQSVSDISSSKCRKMCDNEDECVAFAWTSGGSGIKSLCSLKKNSTAPTSYNSKSTLYIKKGNPSYWILWTFFAILGIVIFMSLCKSPIF